MIKNTKTTTDYFDRSLPFVFNKKSLVFKVSCMLQPRKMKITPVEFIEIRETGNQANTRRILEDDPILSEKQEMSLKEEIRYRAYKDVIYNNRRDNIPWYVAFYVFGGVTLGILTNLVTTLMPLQDVFKNPSQTLERIPITIVGIFVFFGLFILNCSYWINSKYLLTMKHFGIFSLFMGCFSMLYFVANVVVWKKFLNYPSPMPFTKIVFLIFAVLFGIVVVWYRFPVKWRKDIDFQRRFIFLLSALMTNFWFININYVLLGKILITIPENYQWILSLIFPFIREFHTWIELKLAYKAASSTDTSVTISVSHNINTRHCVFLSVMLGTKATDLASWVILITDFIYNTYLTIKIIWIKKQRPSNDMNDQEMFHLLYSLTINELVEVAVPLTYMICFLCAYVGPNGELICDVRSKYFHCIPLSNINTFIKNMATFMVVDFTSVVFNSVLLWVSCKISLIRAYLLMQKEFWLIITITTAATICGVSMILILFNVD